MSAHDNPLHDPTADLTPVTVWLTPADAVRLELLLAAQRERIPTLDDNELVDTIFTTGLDACERELASIRGADA